MSGRAYDALYDLSYTVSGARDHYRQQTLSGGFHVERAPNYPTMFSVLPHHPAMSYRFKNKDKVPAFVDRSFHPAQASVEERTIVSQPVVVAGTDRFKYFRRPMLAAPDPIIIKQGAVPVVPPASPPVQEPRSKTVGTQSDYRENETQTTPWEPDIALPENPSVKQQALSSKYNCSGPELLALKDMKFGDGLPPGLQEVRKIEKMREKRAFEASLPPLHDVEKLPIRQKMIEEWEKMEWADREDEILGVQEERLALLEQALIAREGDYDDTTARRIEDRKTNLLTERADKFASIQAGRIKTMRHLTEARKYVEKPRKLQKLSVIEKYADYGSSVYAPVQRDGKVAQKQTIETEGFQPVSLQGLDELEAYLPSRLLNPCVGVPKKPLKLDYQQRKAAGIQNDLKSINDLLDTAKATKGRGIGEVWPAPLGKDAIGTTPAVGIDPSTIKQQQHLAEKKQQQQRATIRAADRPDTPVLPPSVTPVSAKEAAAILIQRLLRGRATQNAMHEGKMRRQALILELLQEVPPAQDSEDIALDAADEAMGLAFSELLSSLVSNDSTARAQAAKVFSSALNQPVAAISAPPQQSSKPAFVPAPPSEPKSGFSRPFSATYAILNSIVDDIETEVESKNNDLSIPAQVVKSEAPPAPETKTEEAVPVAEMEAKAEEAKEVEVVESGAKAEAVTAEAAESEAVVEAQGEAESKEIAAEAEPESKAVEAVAEAEEVVAEESLPVEAESPVANKEEPVEAEAVVSSSEEAPPAKEEEEEVVEGEAASPAEETEEVAAEPKPEEVAAEADPSSPPIPDEQPPAEDPEVAAAEEPVEVAAAAEAETAAAGEGEEKEEVGPSTSEEPIQAEPSLGVVLGAPMEDEPLMGEASFAGGVLGTSIEDPEAEGEEGGEAPQEGQQEPGEEQ